MTGPDQIHAHVLNDSALGKRLRSATLEGFGITE